MILPQLLFPCKDSSRLENNAVVFVFLLENEAEKDKDEEGWKKRSHKLDNERLYDNAEFTSEADMIKKLKRYNTRYNNIHRKVLNFKNPMFIATNDVLSSSSVLNFNIFLG